MSYHESVILDRSVPFTHRWTHHVRTGFQRVLPDNQADFIVSSTGEAWLSGPPTGVDLPRIEPGTVLKGLRIDTAALRAVVDIDGSVLTDQRVPLADLLPSGVARHVSEAIWMERTDLQFLHRMWPQRKIDARARVAIAALSSGTGVKVQELAEQVGVSPRHLRRMVEQEAGLAPKTIQQVGRIRRALRIASIDKAISMVDIATGAGYSDQAHFGRESRRLTGLTPTLLLQEHKVFG